MIKRTLSLAALASALFANGTSAEAATIQLAPRTDCKKTYVGTYYGNDIYDVYCHFSGTVTFSDPSHSLWRVECDVSDYGTSMLAGYQGGDWGHDGGPGVYGYSQCCDYADQYTWSQVLYTTDRALMLINEGTQYQEVAQGSDVWCPGATL